MTSELQPKKEVRRNFRIKPTKLEADTLPKRDLPVPAKGENSKMSRFQHTLLLQHTSPYSLDMNRIPRDFIQNPYV